MLPLPFFPLCLIAHVANMFPTNIMQIMLPILENLDSAKPVTDNHYWLFTVNIRDRKFEVLDSWRSLQDSKTLDDNARLIAATVRSLWDEEYPNSRVKLDNFRLENIDVPKQDNE